MKIPNIVFDDDTDYDAVSLMLSVESTDIISTSCSCSGGNIDRTLLAFNKYMKASVINKDIPNIARYQDNIKSAYYELKKLDC